MPRCVREIYSSVCVALTIHERSLSYANHICAGPRRRLLVCVVCDEEFDEELSSRSEEVPVFGIAIDRSANHDDWHHQAACKETQKSYASRKGRGSHHQNLGLQISCECIALHHTSMSGSFAAVSTPIFASIYSFLAFFDIYKMCILLHRSNLRILPSVLQQF